MPQQHEISQAAHDRLVAELEDLRTRGRIELADKIERAREHGDLKENAEYHAAKEEKAKMEGRIAQIFGILENCTIIDSTGSTTIISGSIVTLKYEGDDDDEAERYLIGSIEEQTEGVNLISPGSPLGSALIGKAVGVSVEYEAPGGMLRVVVMEVE